jgi:hypothetical protein
LTTQSLVSRSPVFVYSLLVTLVVVGAYVDVVFQALWLGEGDT